MGTVKRQLLPPLRNVLQQRRLDLVPPGWLRIEELAAAEGAHLGSHFRNQVHAARRAGLVKQRLFRARRANGAIAPIPHYKRVK